MSKVLFLFLFSHNIDTYINVIANAWDTLSVRKIQLVYVKGMTTAPEDSEASRINDRIWLQFESLSRGEYIVNFGNASDKPSTRKLAETSRIDVYRKVYNETLNRGLVSIDYEDINHELRSLFRKVGGKAPSDWIIDLTAGTKVPAIDIFSICLALGYKTHIFELKEPVDRNAPEKSLYHMLDKGAYSYACISDRPPVVAGRSAFYSKNSLRWLVMVVALFVLSIAAVFFLVGGSKSEPLQLLMTLSGIVGLLTPILSVFSEKFK